MTSIPESIAGPAPGAVPKRVLPVGPRLRKLLYVVFVLLSLLIANSAYLGAITFLGWVTGHSYVNPFYFLMILGHVALGLLVIIPFLVFAIAHMRNTAHRRNRKAVKVGYALFAISIVVLVTGMLLMRIIGVNLRDGIGRGIVYWLHIITPLLAIWMYVLHRLAGPRIKWKFGFSYLATVVVGVAIAAGLHSLDPRTWGAVGPDSPKYFEPSLARTVTGDFIPARTMMNDEYCKKCHADVHAGWEFSAHRFSSFNNPAYLASVRETRKVSEERDGNVQASRWCAGCHDPVPFFSGAFDNPKFDDVNDPTSQAGITCTVCHSITNVNTTRGNGDYTIEQAQHYPFAFSENPLLQWINNRLIIAKPEFHRETFLKPFHRTAEFCSTCHKVHLPYELNHYRVFVRGQNHYDPYLLSGVSGHGARSFYYPPEAKENCAVCHMPWQESEDFAARPYEGGLAIHDHLFPAANTALGWLNNNEDVIAAHTKFLEGCVRVDLFALKEGVDVEGEIHAPLRPELPTLQPGQGYLWESVIRTLTLGHLLTQGTADSNEVWVDVTVTSGDRVIGRSGGMDERNAVDPWAHRINVFMLDEEGQRINRRNPQAIRVPLYNHQIPPGAGQVVHFELQVPEDLTDHVTIDIKVQYRKFDTEYMDIVTSTAREGDNPIRGHVRGEPYVNELPIVTLASDRITLPVAGVDTPLPEQATPDIPEWQRWNDYGIGLFLEGKAELKQALHAFERVEALGRFDGPLNLARVHLREGDTAAATDAINRAAAFVDPPAPPWTLAFFSGEANRMEGRLADAVQNFRSIVDVRTQEQVDRGFDFSLDYEVLNQLGLTLYEQARQIRTQARAAEREQLLRDAVATFHRTLAIDSENFMAHSNLSDLYQELGDEALSLEHREAHERYKEDDTIRGSAHRLARERYPAANHAAEALVIYPLNRDGAPELPPESVRPSAILARDEVTAIFEE